MTLERKVVTYIFLARGGHAMILTAIWGSTRVIQKAERGKYGRSRYRGFQGKEQVSQGEQV